MNPVLEVNNISVTFNTSGGVIKALDDVSLIVNPGETLAIVGESGCGKTTLARAILGLQPLTQGSISVSGNSVIGTKSENAKNVGMVWQDPYASLDPRWTIEKSIKEPLKLGKTDRSTQEMLEEVGLDMSYARRFPHQMSGGQRQRVAIGRALALRPPLVICDEPTAALDLSIRAQILNLLKDLQKSANCAYLYISHDLTTVRFLADRIAVMYMGQIVETGPASAIFKNPTHPYTKALLDSSPRIDRLMELPEEIIGELPNPTENIPGCKFSSRCPYKQSLCETTPPPFISVQGGESRCHFPLLESVLTIMGQQS